MFWNTTAKGGRYFSYSMLSFCNYACQSFMLGKEDGVPQVGVPQLDMTPARELRKSGNVFSFLVMEFNFP